jgi:hypothetical protein
MKSVMNSFCVISPYHGEFLLLRSIFRADLQTSVITRMSQSFLRYRCDITAAVRNINAISESYSVCGML